MKVLIIIMIGIALGACTPTVKVEAPEKPVEINLNVKIDHSIKIQVDKQLDDVMKKNEDIF